jgi:hypothetical protein
VLRKSTPHAEDDSSLNVPNNVSVSALRTAIVLTGNNTYASAINFPTGNGQSASLTLSAPPGPGATFSARAAIGRKQWAGVVVHLIR